MVLLTHAGYGQREREILLYFWDERDGPEWSGWWITTDFRGNNEYILSNKAHDDSPAAPPVGSWRSVHVEDVQLKRKLQIGFTALSDGTIVANGPDASLPIFPDGKMQIVFSELAFQPVERFHGKPAYRAVARAAARRRWSLSPEVLHMAGGVMVGALVTSAAFWLSARARR
ncbi:hypothetical protein AB1Y20_009639 [Prymnesium parvum]|uniref:Uncharacterized protein n=1 Tax=Prymnesium parvum TaxID=97485 RepID=A0AB34K507_PRYPA|eukprot:CAMPEP_0182829674 /NCGR_PEP_ID=MMETSP0006_2-20121128/18164_1 /TAXON_ID=97485 /ORGANISM="Prymnesium parvum, Strain Texoma1" /LENGTH=171 /DNA_ID=CAMNT_0024957183 /DNA_START=12 /DNA_END=527 /DNA_ORIENTATION=-